MYNAQKTKLRIHIEDGTIKSIETELTTEFRDKLLFCKKLDCSANDSDSLVFLKETGYYLGPILHTKYMKQFLPEKVDDNYCRHKYKREKHGAGNDSGRGTR